jgi:hypothetical protein
MIIQRAPRLPEAECMEGEETLQWALAYAASGQPVFPCRSSGPRAKTPLTPNGFYDASADPERIASWWTRHPDAAIGIPTGAPYFTVLDIDKMHVDGFDAYQRLHRAGLLNGGGRLVQTPSGGIHRYFRGGAHRNASLRDLGVDLRGVGGYVIAPPTWIDSPDRQGRYEVLREYTVRPAPLDWQACRSLLAPSCPARRGITAAISRLWFVRHTPSVCRNPRSARRCAVR